jgi:uncharacterized membrane-anchored protein YitT (DUF2179 family)
MRNKASGHKVSERNKLFYDYALIITGTTLMAIAITVFLAPDGLVTGGASGLSLIIRGFVSRFGIDFPIWLGNILINAPLFLLGAKRIGLKFLWRTIFATGYFSLALFYTGFIPAVSSDLTLSAVFGGVLLGAGIGMVFRASATTGGSDLASRIINDKFRHISVSRLMFWLDSAVIALGFFVFGPVNAMYSIIAVFITSRVIDSILEGMSFAKAAFIISENSEAIAQMLLTELERGATSLYGKGMYTKTEKNVLLCVVSNKEVVKLKDLVRKLDGGAFVIVADVREVLGLGFKETE